MIKEDINSKYSLLLTTGRALFWKYGFKRVTIQEICKEADISKMTFYRFFENKTDLAKAVFDREENTALETFRNILEEKSSSQEKIKKIIAMKRGGVNGISKEFLKDFYNSDELSVRTLVEEKTKSAWSEMIGDFKKAQKKGWFREDMKPEFFFYFTEKAGEMLNDESLTKLYNSPQELLAEFTNFFAYGISPHK